VPSAGSIFERQSENLSRRKRNSARNFSAFQGANAMTLRRRTFLRLVPGAAALPALTRFARAQTFPSKPVTLIVPWPPGGTTDVAVRALATATERHLGKSIVIENKAGAAGTLGPAQMAALAKPDGYTVSQLPISVFRLPFMSRTSFDPAKDFTYIIGLSGYTFGVVVRSDAPWKTFPELLAAAKANPGTMTYGTPGAGTSLHITMEQIAKQQGTSWSMFHSKAPPKRRPRSSVATFTRWRTPRAGLRRSTRASCGCWCPGVRRGQRIGRQCPL
jgi:hypothetical protein